MSSILDQNREQVRVPRSKFRYESRSRFHCEVHSTMNSPYSTHFLPPYRTKFLNEVFLPAMRALDSKSHTVLHCPVNTAPSNADATVFEQDWRKLSEKMDSLVRNSEWYRSKAAVYYYVYSHGTKNVPNTTTFMDVSVEIYVYSVIAINVKNVEPFKTCSINVTPPFSHFQPW